MIRKVPYHKLIEDLTIYPRNTIDGSHVNNLARAIKAGADLPPVVVERSTYRIVDGIHRSRGWLAVFGPDASVPCDIRSYPNEAALLQDAVALNSAHGRPLGSTDLTRAAHLLRGAGLDDETIAVTMSTTLEHVKRVLLHIVLVDDEPQPAKPSLWPNKGEAPRHLTPEQATVHRSASGWRHAQTIRTLTRELQEGLVDIDRHADLLAELRRALDDVLALVS